MRLTETQRTVIREETQRQFGADARVLLFGSRVRDDARGGDIDLYIDAGDCAARAEDALDRELALHAALQRRLGEQRIDIVVHRPHTPLRPIDIEARKHGVPV